MKQRLMTEIDGIDISYEVSGEGKPLLLLHGWGGQIDSWLPVTEHYAAARKVYVIDFPGFGKSSIPPSTWSVGDYMNCLKKWMDSQNLKKVDIMGHSFGGRVSIMLASCFPEYVDRLVLVDSAGLKPKRSLKYYFKVYTYKVMKKIARYSGLVKLFKVFKVDIEERMRSKSGSADYRALPESMRGTFVKVVNEDLKKYLSGIKASTLLIYGEDDKDTPPYFGEIMKKTIPDAGLVILKNAGHFAYLDQFYSFIKITDAFLEVTL